MNVVNIITSVWGVAQYLLAIVCLGAVAFGTLAVLALPFIALISDDKKR